MILQDLDLLVNIIALNHYYNNYNTTIFKVLIEDVSYYYYSLFIKKVIFNARFYFEMLSNFFISPSMSLKFKILFTFCFNTKF